MQAAEASLRELNIYEPDPAIYTAVLSKVRRASLDCYVREVSLPVRLLYSCILLLYYRIFTIIVSALADNVD